MKNSQPFMGRFTATWFLSETSWRSGGMTRVLFLLRSKEESFGSLKKNKKCGFPTNLTKMLDILCD
jgi:hypothetical protein